MTLGELLELLRASILNDRSDRVGGSNDYLWTDETLVTYISEAQRRFASKALVLRDGTTPEFTRVTLVAGQSHYVLNKAVLAVLSVKRADYEPDLTRLGHPVLAAYRAPSDSWVDPAGYTGMQPGVPLAYSTDEEVSAGDGTSVERIVLRVYPKPRTEDAGEVLYLRVLRKPAKLTINDLEAEPEIPEDHHIEMLDWAAYLALRIVDDDAGSPARANEFAASFEAHTKTARTSVMRKLFAPAGWGFGRGGFTWDS